MDINIKSEHKEEPTNRVNVLAKDSKGNALAIQIKDYIVASNGNSDIRLRYDEENGWICATDMCAAYKKIFYEYKRRPTTKQFIAKLKQNRDITMAEKSSHGNNEVIRIIQGGNDSSIRGTYIHPYLAIHLAMWLDADFAINVIEMVYRIMSKDVSVITDIAKYFADNKAISQEEHDNIVSTLNNRINLLDESYSLLSDKATNLENRFITEDQFITHIDNISPISLLTEFTYNDLQPALIKALHIEGKKVKFILTEHDTTKPSKIIRNAYPDNYDERILATSCSHLKNFIRAIRYEDKIASNYIHSTTINSDIYSKLLIIVYNQVMTKPIMQSSWKYHKTECNKQKKINKYITRQKNAIEEARDEYEEKYNEAEDRYSSIVSKYSTMASKNKHLKAQLKQFQKDIEAKDMQIIDLEAELEFFQISDTEYETDYEDDIIM